MCSSECCLFLSPGVSSTWRSGNHSSSTPVIVWRDAPDSSCHRKQPTEVRETSYLKSFSCFSSFGGRRILQFFSRAGDSFNMFVWFFWNLWQNNSEHHTVMNTRSPLLRPLISYISIIIIWHYTCKRHSIIFLIFSTVWHKLGFWRLELFFFNRVKHRDNKQSLDLRFQCDLKWNSSF